MVFFLINTKKNIRRITERVNQCEAEMQTLNRTKQELTEGKSKIDDIINRLEREEVIC